MNSRRLRSAASACFFTLWAWLASGLFAQAASVPRTARASVVKVYATIQYFNYALPWQASNPMSGTGSGFVIGKRRILTNAHVVSNARYLEVQKEGDPKRYLAEVEFVGHDCDLAVLKVSDSEFFRGTAALDIGSALPSLDDEVIVLGYPLGGTRMSVTRGVISRIDHSMYSHSGADVHLVLQVDAAINPGNSGGPVLFKGKVVGMAFQVLTQGQNIGYAIPIPVLRHFLADIEDGAYNGYPELGVADFDLRNPALRTDLKLPDDRTGIVVFRVDPFGSANGALEAGDVLLTIDGHGIANDGTIGLDGNAVDYTELLERKQWGESVTFDVWRNGRDLTVALALKNPADPFTFRNEYDKKPEYYIVGGLVFSVLSNEYMRNLGTGLASAESQHLYYYSQYAKIDGYYKDRDAFVVLVNRLAHPVNTYGDMFLNGIVSEVNGRHIRNLPGLRQAVEQSTNDFHVIRFEGNSNMLVLNAASVKKAEPAILKAYGVPARSHLEERP